MTGTTLATSSYDSHDNRISVTDARNHATASSYDDLGRVRTVTSPDTGTTNATYDQAGNLLTLTDAKGQTITATYDALNRPLTQSYPGATRSIVSTYDQPFKGLLSTIQEEESNRSFAYNTLGQVISETKTIGTTTATVHYAYDATTGELASITYPSGRVLSFSRDSAGLISGLAVDGAPLVTNIASLPYGPVTSATLGTVNLTRSYDQRYQMSRLQAGSLDSTYTRDQAGRVTGITNIPGPAAETFTTTSTIHPDSNQLLGLSGSETIAYSHDANGNVIIDGSFTYTWDALNRLVRVQESGSIIATYGYDSQNRRIRKTVGGQTIHYHYDLNNQLIAESLTDGTPLRDYFYLGNEPIALREYQNNPGLYFYVTDHLGTPRRLITATGSVAWEAAYLPFGHAQVLTGTVQNNLRFPGQYFDAETGLHYNWNRFYDPETGRYLSADPIGLEGGMNLYGYSNQNPINYIDPDGRFVMALPFIIGGISGEAIAGALAGLGLSAAIATVVDELNDIDRDKNTIPWPERTRGQWSCICRADKAGRRADNCSADDRDVAYGWGVDPLRDVARKTAEDMAKSKLSAQSVHHVSCKCTGPKGEKWNRGG